MTADEPTQVSPALLREWPLPQPGSDKEDRGRVVVAGGTTSTPGACLLAGTSALRAGAGKLAVLTAEAVAPSLAVAMPEASVTGLPADRDGNVDLGASETVVAAAEAADAFVAGPGFRSVEASVALLEPVLPQIEVGLVLDALGSAFLTEHADGLRHLAGRVVLTVNPRELARVAGVEEEDVQGDPAAHAVEVARRSQVVVLCGGQAKHVAAPDGRVWVVAGGGPGLGVSGSGDVQAGVVGGLLARGAGPAQAAVWAAYVHARCGERLAAAVAPLGYLARELPGEIPAVLREVG